MQCTCIRFAKATTMDEIVSRISLERFNRAFVRNYILLIHVDVNAGQDPCRIYKNVSSIQQEMLAEREISILYLAAVHTHSALLYILVHMNV